MTFAAQTTIKSAKIIKLRNFCQIPNKIYDLSMTGTSSIPAAPFQTLCFILRLHPDTIITPKNISKQMEIRATVTGGKFKKPETIRAEFRKLISGGYMRSQLSFDSKGGAMPTQYFLNYDKILGGVGEISIGGKIDDKDAVTKEKQDEMGGGENSTPPYNKVRVVYNTENNTNNPKDCNSIVNQKILTPCRGDFLALVPNDLRDKDIWKLINSVRKYLKEAAYDTFEKAFKDPEIENPINWLWGAVKKKKADIEKRQSLNNNTSSKDIPAKPQKSNTDIKGELKIRGENIPTMWCDFLYMMYTKDPKKAAALQETPEKEILNCHEFIDYLKRKKVI